MASYSNYRAPPLKHTFMTTERIDKYISNAYFSDVNLRSRLLSKTIEAAEILHYPAKGRFDFEIAKSAAYSPKKVGDSFGPLWSTHWFRVKFVVPEDLTAALKEYEEVLFYWDSSSEATIWDEVKGHPIGAFSCAEPHGNVREYFPVSNEMLSSKRVEFLLEVTCNKDLGEGNGSFIAPPNEKATYSLKRCQMAVRDSRVYSLLTDLKILHDIAKELKDKERGFVALYTANEIVNRLQSTFPDAISKAQELAADYFSQGSGPNQHTVHAVGHCHMDCAWLWPFEETKRKCARSWSATLDLMNRYPNWKFACSSAQQYEWVQHHYPLLFAQIQESVKSGRFIPVGGSWVEMDGYLPSGESMCRQLLYGQSFFLREFGIKSTEFWLPDTFGYSAQLPQIISHFGMNRFFTQKISWNLINKFPHHTFYWKGLDGSCVLSHFAPGDSYHMKGEVGELVKTSTNFEDKGRSNKSLYLFGHGDGGQGPTQDMLENLDRLKDIDGLPRVELSTPAEFFTSIEEKEARNLCTWSGELYLEMHNGTYTTQSKIKWYNRRCESLLHNLEFLSTLAYIHDLSPYPFISLDKLWKGVLLNQFHDVLPGSSIEATHKDARAIYTNIIKEGKALQEELLQQISDKTEGVLTVCNALSWPRTELVAVETACVLGDILQEDLKGRAYQLVSVGALAISQPTMPSFIPVSVKRMKASTPGSSDWILMENSKVYAELDYLGRITWLSVKEEGELKTPSRNLLSGAANQFAVYDDIPLFWDAWDVMGYHQETRRALTDVIAAAVVVEEGPLRGSIEVSIKISDRSYLKQIIVLDAESPYLRVDCEIYWHENRKFLKVEFPLNIVSDHVTYETQFGHIRRPTHRNTSWDSAKYEVCCQRWMDLSDYSVGVSIMNDSKYGCSVTDHSTLHLSLLRAPKAPDANADMGTHRFSYAVMPHTGSFQEAGVIRRARDLNSPLLVKGSLSKIKETSLVVCDQPSIVLDTIKAAECDRNTEVKGPKSLILRCYESYGGSCSARFTIQSHSVDYVAICDGLEKELEQPIVGVGDSQWFITSFSPFQVKTIKVVLL
ncbi:alpha-mannosidase 2C1-like [Watersipora subatra]|uniref:alpha-mannosidase 2C1-like n=1 Tax=Watersipora subatra TaxID=2589382 RepID=UPI00355AFFDD